MKVMNEEGNYVPKYDESKDLEIIYDFHKSQIWRVNTTNTDLFLKSGNEFDKGLLERLDEKKRCRLIYVIDTIPPLTAILKHIENPFPIEWAILAIVINKDAGFVQKINPIISYALGLTQYKNKFIVGVFDYSHRNDLTEVVKWIDSKMEIQIPDNPVEWIESKSN